MAMQSCALYDAMRSARTARYGRLAWLGLVSLTGTAFLLPTCLTPVYAQSVKMTKTFTNVSTELAYDFHMETSLLVLQKPKPTSTAFTKVDVPAASKYADFEEGTVAANASHDVTWYASGKNSKVVNHYFTRKDHSEIKKSSTMAALTNDVEYNLIGGGYQVALLTYNDTSNLLAGAYTIYAKPQNQFFSSSWDDPTGARVLQDSTSYSLSGASSGSPGNYSLLNDEYLLILGTADDGGGTKFYRTAFNNTTAPEPGALGLMGAGCCLLGLAVLRQRGRC